MKVSPKVFAEIYTNKHRDHEFFFLFNLMFDVTVARQIVERDGIKPQLCGKEYVEPMVGIIHVNEDKIPEADTDIPLIAVSLEVEEGIMFLVIDGYHRIRKLQPQNPEQYNCFVLDVEQTKEVRIG